MAADVKQISDNPRPTRRVSADVVARSLMKPGLVGNPFALPSFPPAVMAAMKADKIPTLAQDDMIAGTMGWASTDQVAAVYNEGLVFLGYSYLAVLSQRPEYRVVTEVISTEMTREWIEIKVASGDESKNEKVKFIEDELDRLDIRASFRKVCELDGFFGRGHLYLDTGMTDDSDELKTDIGNGRSQLSKLKIGMGKRQKLIGVRSVEATWAYPTNYESIDPLKREWYKPKTWYVMSREIHRSRFLSFVGREVPDILKPAYAFGGLSMSQMLKPYVDNWLRTRTSVSDLIQNFSVNVLRTNMDATTSVGGEALFSRVQLFNNVKNNQGTMVIDKDSEDWSNVAVPLGGLDSLQAQSQEHMAAISRIPLVKLLGIQPAGLNASSEGELVAFEDWIAAFQELLFRQHLTTIIDFIQLSTFGKIDQDIIFDFKPLRQQKPEDLAQIEATKAQTREVYAQLGSISAEEVREVLAEDPDSPFEGLDLSKPLPAPPMPGPGELGGMPGGGGAPPPAGGGGPGAPPPVPPVPAAVPPPPGAPSGSPDAAPFSAANNDDFLPSLVRALNAAAGEEAFDEFQESKVKRDHGRFARQAGTVASKAAEHTTQFLKNYTKEDFHALKHRLEGGSEERRSFGQKVAHLAAAPFHILANHFKNIGHHAKHAAAGLRAIAYGAPVTKEQWVGMGNLGFSVLASAVGTTHGDPTGAGAHAAAQGATFLVQEFGKELAHHAAIEHGAKLVAGVGRYALAKAGYGGGDAAFDDDDEGFTPSDEDIERFRDYLKVLAKSAADWPIPDADLMAALRNSEAQSAQDAAPVPLDDDLLQLADGQPSNIVQAIYALQAERDKYRGPPGPEAFSQGVGEGEGGEGGEEGGEDVAQDKDWDESKVKRGQPGNAGQFSSTGASKSADPDKPGKEPSVAPSVSRSTHAKVEALIDPKHYYEHLYDSANKVFEEHGFVLDRDLSGFTDQIIVHKADQDKWDETVDPETLPAPLKKLYDHVTKASGEAASTPASLAGADIGKAARAVITALDYDPAKFRINRGDRPFNLNGRQYMTAGLAHLDTGEIEIFPSQLTRASVAGVVAHETQHQKFEKVITAYMAERERMHEDKRNGRAWILKPDDTMRDEYAKDYPIYTAFHPVIEKMGIKDKLIETDGVSEYSRDWWQAYGKHEASFKQAAHETLAEMARLDWEHGGGQWGLAMAAPVWRKAYSTINKIYHDHDLGETKPAKPEEKPEAAKAEAKEPKPEEQAAPSLVPQPTHETHPEVSPSRPPSEWLTRPTEAEPPEARAERLYTTAAKELTPEQFIETLPPHQKEFVAATDARIKPLIGHETHQLVKDGGFRLPDGGWTPERLKVHEKIINDILTKAAIARTTPKPGEKPVYLMMGGRGGSGKSWFSNSPETNGKPGLNCCGNILVLNNDDIKEALPGYEGWNAFQFHEEASHIFDRIDAIAREKGLNIAHDATLKSYDSGKRYADLYKGADAGYKITGLYMFLPPQDAANRAVGRAMSQKPGEPPGRYVPPYIVLSNKDNEKNFDRLAREYMAGWSIYRNDDDDWKVPPKLVFERKEGE